MFGGNANWEPLPGERFEPSVNTKNRWTYTRKSSYNAAGIRLPGLFTTAKFDTDALAFAAVLLLEGYGLVMLVTSFGLFDAVGSLNWLGIGGVIAAFLLDLTLAYGRHLPTGAECRYRNRRVNATTPQDIAQLENDRGRFRGLAFICALLILVLATIKIYLFYMLNEDLGITGLTASVLVSYVIVAILHINNTGYFLSALYFRRRIRKDYNEWANNGRNAHELTIHGRRPYPIDVPRNEQIDIKETRAGEHFIRKGKSGEGPYVLETSGVLTDRDLQTLVVKQPTNNAKTTVARACLQAQLDILDAQPLQVSSEPVEEPQIAEPESETRSGVVTPMYPEAAKGKAS